jgi:hypothetical protein
VRIAVTFRSVAGRYRAPVAAEPRHRQRQDDQPTEGERPAAEAEPDERDPTDEEQQACSPRHTASTMATPAMAPAGLSPLIG